MWVVAYIDACGRCVCGHHLLTNCVCVWSYAAVVRCSASAPRLLLSSSGGRRPFTSPAGHSAPSWSVSLQRPLTGNISCHGRHILFYQTISCTIADGPCNMLCQSESCQLLHNWPVGTHCLTNPQQIEVMELEGTVYWRVINCVCPARCVDCHKSDPQAPIPATDKSFWRYDMIWHNAKLF